MRISEIVKAERLPVNPVGSVQISDGGRSVGSRYLVIKPENGTLYRSADNAVSISHGGDVRPSGHGVTGTYNRNTQRRSAESVVMAYHDPFDGPIGIIQWDGITIAQHGEIAGIGKVI
jgi:hypothetical protein